MTNLSLVDEILGLTLSWTAPDHRGVQHAELRARNLGGLTYGRMTDDYILLVFGAGMAGVRLGGKLRQVQSWTEAATLIERYVERRRSGLLRTLSLSGNESLRRDFEEAVKTAKLESVEVRRG